MITLLRKCWSVKIVFFISKMCFCVLSHATGHSRWSNQINKDVPKSRESKRKKINYLSIRDRWEAPCDAQFKEFTFFLRRSTTSPRLLSLSLSVSLVHIAMAYAQLMQPLGNIRTWKFNKKKKTKERNHVIAKWGTTSMAKFERITSLDTQTANKQTQLADLR